MDYTVFIWVLNVLTQVRKLLISVRDGSIIGHAACFPQSGVPSYGSTFSVQHIKKGSKVWARESYDTIPSRIGLEGKLPYQDF